MMDYLRIARPEFDALNPFVFGETRGDTNELVIDGAAGGHGERVRQRDLKVGLTEYPALCKTHRRRQVFLLALGSARIGPGDERVDLTLRQRAVVQELAVLGVGEPGRHAFEQHGFANRLRPRTSILVGEERHGRDFTGPVTSLAVLLQN